MADPIVMRRTVTASPAEVWPYFSDGAMWARWQGQQCTIEPVPGGRFTMTMPDGATAAGQVVEVAEHRRLVITWGWVGSPLAPGSTRVEITLEPVPDGGTLITLIHSGLPDGQIDHHTMGWNLSLDRLLRAIGGLST